MPLNIFKKRIKVLVHDGRFHADEVFAVAALKRIFSVKVIRSRDPKYIDIADIVLDTGHVYDHEQKKYDHHQREGAGERENGVPYASFGLIWKHYGPEICGSEEVSKIVDESIVQPIDASDTGYESFRAEKESLNTYVLDIMIKSFNPIKGRNEDAYKMFLKAVNIAFDILEREIYKAKQKKIDMEKVKEIYENTEDKRILVFDEIMSFGKVLDDIPEPIYSISPGESGEDWRVYAIPVNSRNSYNQRKKFPEDWGGLRNEEFERVSGVVGAKFCHRAGFLCGAKTKDGALELAKRSLKV